MSGRNHTEPSLEDLETGQLAVAMIVLGFLTIGAQVILVREIFSTLYGSDLAIAFTLASWTACTGAGAYAWGRWGADVRKGLPTALVVYTVLATATFLGIRRWGATELIAFRDYMRIPLFLALPCLLGGALFPWGIRAAGKNSPRGLSAAYADETVGGTLAGLAMVAYFAAGGLSLPALVMFTVLAVVVPFVGSGRRSRFRCIALSGLLLAAALAPPFRPLAVATLRLHYPEGTVTAHRNTAHGTLTAVQRESDVVVFENGVPVPSPVLTPNKLAVAGLLTQLPKAWNRILLVNAASAGYASAVGGFRTRSINLHETDAAKIAFLEHQFTGFSVPERLTLHTGASTWSNLDGAFDLIALFASPPGSLLENRLLTAEYFRTAAEHLDDGGVLIAVLPVAPGFTHPLQQRYLDSVADALRTVCPHVSVWRTELGCMTMIGSNAPINTVFQKKRLDERLSGTDAGIAAEVSATMDAGESPILPPSPSCEAKPSPNSIQRPAAYFAYLQFRGRMIDEAGGLTDRVFRSRPTWCSCALLGGILACSLLAARRRRRTAALFWASWGATVTVMGAVYLCQSVLGQAYVLVALIVACSLGGICLGARAWAGDGGRHWQIAAVVGVVVVPALFAGFPVFSALPSSGAVLCLLLANLLAGFYLGTCFAAAADGQLSAGLLCFVDLLGGAGGLLLGSVLLPWWSGFQLAFWASAAAAIAALGLDR